MKFWKIDKWFLDWYCLHFSKKKMGGGGGGSLKNLRGGMLNFENWSKDGGFYLK